MSGAGLCSAFLLPHSLRNNEFDDMKFMLGKKIGMSQIFASNGEIVPVTFIQAGPLVLVQKRESEKDGYRALQFGYGARKTKRIAKAQRGHFGELGNFEVVRELRLKEESNLKRGDTVNVNVFKEGDEVNVSGISKAKGFQGVVKRHGFRGAPATHGTKHALREPGSIGGAGLRSHVIKGTRMAGRMGGERVTIEGLTVMKVDAERNVLVVKGATPGARGGLLEIRGK